MTKLPKQLLPITKFSQESFYLAALLFSYASNFLFSIFVGRFLSLEEFGIVALLTSLWYLISIFLNSLTFAINYKTSYLTHKFGKVAGSSFFKNVYAKLIRVSFLIAIVWFIISPLLTNYFKINQFLPLISLSPIIILGAANAIIRGYLQGKKIFIFAGLLLVIEAVSKLIFAVILVLFKQFNYVYLYIPLSVSFAFVSALFVMSKIENSVDKNESYDFPTKFFFSSIFNNISIAAFLTLDLILAKHYLSPNQAGVYGLLNLLGKITYFFGSMFNVFLITKIAELEGKNKNSERVFYKFLGASTLLSIFAPLFFVLSSKFSISFLLGKHAIGIIPYVLPYTFAIMLFTISNTIVSFHLAKKQYTIAILPLIMIIFMAVGIFLHHADINDIVSVLLTVSLLNTVIVLGAHISKFFNFFNKNSYLFLNKFPNYEK